MSSFFRVFFHLCRPSSTTTISKKKIICSQTNSNDYRFRQNVSTHQSNENQIGNKYNIPYFHLCSKLFICESSRACDFMCCLLSCLWKHSRWFILHPCSILNELLQFSITFIRTHINMIWWIVPPMSNIMFYIDSWFITIRTYTHATSSGKPSDLRNVSVKSIPPCFFRTLFTIFTGTYG